MVFCTVCFGDPASPLTQGYNWGVIVMLVVTVLMLAAVAGLFISIALRMKKFKKLS